MGNLPLDIPPGLLLVDSPNAGQGRFIDCDKVRFVRGKPEKWAGWDQFIPEQLAGMARGAVAWADVDGFTDAALGTNLKLYAITGDGVLSDITPERRTDTLGSSPFATTNGQATVTVTHVAHGAGDDDYVTFSGATAVAGLTISGEYQIASIVDSDSYTISAGSNANATTTGGGSAVEAVYQINAGSADTVLGTGWGAGGWGEEEWGTPRTTTGIELQHRTWSLQSYGNYLLASPFGGSLYLWNPATDTKAHLVANAPVSMSAMFVTPERFIMALGTTTPMTVQWPDRDDPTDWTPVPENTANERKLQYGTKLIAGAGLGDGISLVWSDTSLYVFQYDGSDYVYDSRLAGKNCGLAAPLAFAIVSQSMAFWMSASNLHMYAGGVSEVPNSLDILETVFKDIDRDQITKTFALYDQRNAQVRWHYCSQGSSEPDRYFDVNIKEWTWTWGTLDRTTGTLFKSSDHRPLMVDHSGNVYLHDVGLDADGDPIDAYITYGLYTLLRGEQMADIMGLIPDVERQTGNLTYEIFTKDRPNSATNQDSATLTAGPTDVILDPRIEGRHFGMTIRSNELGGDFRLGIVSLEVQPSGARR